MKRNLIASYISQFYITAIAIFMVPLYIKFMGAEAYGLVGFFTMLQAWFNLLDMGLTPTIARESARFHGGAITLLEYRRLTCALEGLFAVIALLGGFFLFYLAETIATDWLSASHLSESETITSLRLIAIIVALRWMSGFYRGVVTGAERLVWLSGMNSAIATVRFVLVIPILIFIGNAPWIFFVFQLFVTVLELVWLIFQARNLLPTIQPNENVVWQWAPIKPVLKFSLSIAFTSSVWVLVTQTDKLILSKILPLSDYAYFTVAALLAGGIMLVSGPISSVLMPRMARLQAEGRHDELIALYRRATRMVTLVAIPTTLVLAFFSRQVLWAWTGNEELVSKVAPALTLYAIGYCFLALGAFPYYLQYAKGDLKLHLIGNAFFVTALVPSVIWAANVYGITGAGWAWLVSNTVYFFGWTPLVHGRFQPGLHLKWLIADIFSLSLPAIAFAFLVDYKIPFSNQRIILSGELIILWVLLVCALLARQLFRKNSI